MQPPTMAVLDELYFNAYAGSGGTPQQSPWWAASSRGAAGGGAASYAGRGSPVRQRPLPSAPSLGTGAAAGFGRGGGLTVSTTTARQGHHHEPWPNSAYLTGISVGASDGALDSAIEAGDLSANLGHGEGTLLHGNMSGGFEAMFSDD